MSAFCILMFLPTLRRIYRFNIQLKSLLEQRQAVDVQDLAVAVSRCCLGAYSCHLPADIKVDGQDEKVGHIKHETNLFTSLLDA